MQSGTEKPTPTRRRLGRIGRILIWVPVVVPLLCMATLTVIYFTGPPAFKGTPVGNTLIQTEAEWQTLFETHFHEGMSFNAALAVHETGVLDGLDCNFDAPTGVEEWVSVYCRSPDFNQYEHLVDETASRGQRWNYYIGCQFYFGATLNFDADDLSEMTAEMYQVCL